MYRSFTFSLLVLLALAVSSGCRDMPLAANVNQNMTPVADAGKMQKLDYRGSPIAVKLDGSASDDADGSIVTYRWLSGQHAPDGGIGRTGPDPDDIEAPTVMLGEGTWVFVLFVIDNDGGVSLPSTVTIQVGNAVPPEVTQCVSTGLPSVSEDCRACLCGVSDACRMAVKGCTEGCWDLLFCSDTKCGNLDPSDMSAQASCVGGMCAEFLSSGVQVAAISPCRNMEACSKLCAASAQGK